MKILQANSLVDTHLMLVGGVGDVYPMVAEKIPPAFSVVKRRAIAGLRNGASRRLLPRRPRP